MPKFTIEDRHDYVTDRLKNLVFFLDSHIKIVLIYGDNMNKYILYVKQEKERERENC